MGTCLKFPLNKFLERENSNLNISVDNSINNYSNISIENIKNIPSNLVIDELFNDITKQMKPFPKLNIVFKITSGFNINLIVNEFTAIDSTLKYYWRRINRVEYIGSNEICFLYNARKLHFGDQTPVILYFENCFNPKVVVNDVYDKLSNNWTREDEDQRRCHHLRGGYHHRYHRKR